MPETQPVKNGFRSTDYSQSSNWFKQTITQEYGNKVDAVGHCAAISVRPVPERSVAAGLHVTQLGSSYFASSQVVKSDFCIAGPR